MGGSGQVLEKRQYATDTGFTRCVFGSERDRDKVAWCASPIWLVFETMPKKSAPSAFISYSWDSAAHKTWVRQLAERLVTNGVKIKLDQWNVAPGESLTAFMETELQA